MLFAWVGRVESGLVVRYSDEQCKTEALALERRHWDDLHVSPLEIQEMFARDVVHGRQVTCLKRLKIKVVGTATACQDAPEMSSEKGHGHRCCCCVALLRLKTTRCEPRSALQHLCEQ